MNQDETLPSYTQLSSILQKIQPNCHASQVHGLLCGYICATSGDVIDFWDSVFPGIKKNRKTQEVLKELYEATYHQLSEFSFEFALILPDDDSGINGRAEALGLWCQGFLTGLEQSDISTRMLSNAELKETLDDMIEIAQLTFDDLESNEEDETAYFDLVEYVRLGVQMIFQELRSKDDEGTKDD